MILTQEEIAAFNQDIAETEGTMVIDLKNADESFDAIISQCSFFVSGDVPRALKEAGRMLKKGGKLVFSDVTRDVVKLLSEVRAAGFAVRHMEDMSDEWKEYYLEALWRDESNCHPTGEKVNYVLFICERL